MKTISDIPSSCYRKSFTRNIGVVSSEDQYVLSRSKVAVAGLGGIGGATFLALVRMGVGRFHIADIDTFDIANLNRQVGSNHATFGRPKVDVMLESALAINPDLEITAFPQGVNRESVDAFLKDVDAVVDSIDYFCLRAREILQEACYQKHIPVMFSVPLGFSCGVIGFDKDSMSFKDYFDFSDDLDPFEKMLRFTVGIAPSALHLKYMKFDKERLIELETGPSISSAVNLGSAFLATEVLMSLIKMRRMLAAPNYMQIDMRTGLYVRKRLLFGNRGPIQRLKLKWARNQYQSEKKAFLKFIR